MLMTVDDDTTTNHNNKFCQQSTGLGVGGVGGVVACACTGCRVAPTWDCGSVLLQLTFWITLWLITFELHSREHFLLGVTLIFFGFFSG